MNIGDAIVLAAIILALGAVTTTIALKVKNKVLTIILYSTFVIIISFTVVFKNDFSKYLSQGYSISKSLGSSKQRLSFKNLDVYNLTLDDVLFYWGKLKPYRQWLVYGIKDDEISNYITPDSSLLYYYNNSVKINDDNCKRYFKDSITLSNIKFIDSLSDDAGTLFLFKSKKVIFIGEKNIINHSFHEYNNYSYVNEIIKKFGKPSKIWISENDNFRVYQIDDQFFFRDYNGNVFAWGIATTDNFNPQIVRPFINGLRLRLIK